MLEQLSKGELISLNKEKQLDFLKFWCEFNQTSIDDKLAEADCLLVIYTGINELFNNALLDFTDHYKHIRLVEQGYVTSERFSVIIAL